MVLLPPSHFASPPPADALIVPSLFSWNGSGDRKRASPFFAIADPLRAYRDGLVRVDESPPSRRGEAALLRLLPRAMRLELGDVRPVN